MARDGRDVSRVSRLRRFRAHALLSLKLKKKRDCSQSTVQPTVNKELSPGGVGGGTPLYKPYRYVPPRRGGVLRRFGLKTGIHFAHIGLESGIVFEGTTECMNVFTVTIPNE